MIRLARPMSCFDIAPVQGRFDNFVAKPWTGAGLIDVVKKQLTDYVIAERDDLMRFLAALDAERLLAEMDLLAGM